MKNIVILATGGTIAGAGEQGKDIGYKSGSIKAQTLIDAIPELKNVANIFVEQVCNINSDDITSEIWISLALRIKELFENGFGDSHELVDGIVIMHGTDTMEETAFFLSLVLNVAKPVILTGSMRPATAAEPDGPANLLFAVKSAVALSSPSSCHPGFIFFDHLRLTLRVSNFGSIIKSSMLDFATLALNAIQRLRGHDPRMGTGSPSRYADNAATQESVIQEPVILEARSADRNHNFSCKHLAIGSSEVYVAFAGKLMDARSVQKIHANDLDAFAEIGAAQSSRPTFDIFSLHSLPSVSVLYFNADADAEFVRFAAERSAGLVIAGAGAGEFSQSWMNAIGDVVAKSNVPVVISTRINRGSIVPEQLLVPGTIAAYSLPPAKAAVLLRLALTITNDPAAIQKFYQRYT